MGEYRGLWRIDKGSRFNDGADEERLSHKFWLIASSCNFSSKIDFVTSSISNKASKTQLVGQPQDICRALLKPSFNPAQDDEMSFLRRQESIFAENHRPGLPPPPMTVLSYQLHCIDCTLRFHVIGKFIGKGTRIATVGLNMPKGGPTVGQSSPGSITV